MWTNPPGSTDLQSKSGRRRSRRRPQGEPRYPWANQPHPLPVVAGRPQGEGPYPVNAMERDTGTTIATKADLQLLRQEVTAAMDQNSAELRQEAALVRKDIEIMSKGTGAGTSVPVTGAPRP